MSIIRRKRNRDYTILNNDIFTCGLTADAVAILAYLLSRPDDWSVNAMQLKTVFNFGRNKMYKVLKDLENAGFIQRKQTRNRHSKQFTETDYLVFDEPQATTDSVPCAQNEDTVIEDEKQPDLLAENSHSRVPDSGPCAHSRVPIPVCPKQAHILSTDITNTEITNKDAQVRECARSDQEWFEKFIEAYPDKSGMPVEPARKTFFEELKAGTDPGLMVEAARGYAVRVRAEGCEARYICNAGRWLSERRFVTAGKPVGKTKAARSGVFVDEGTAAWQAWSIHYRNTRGVDRTAIDYRDPDKPRAAIRRGHWFVSEFPLVGKAVDGAETTKTIETGDAA